MANYRDVPMVLHISASSWTFHCGHLAPPPPKNIKPDTFPLVVSSFFPLFWFVLFWSAPALPSSFFLLSFLPSSFPGGGWSRFCSVVIPPFLRLSLLCLSLLLPWPGEVGVVLFSPSPSLAVSFPASLAFPFSFCPLVGSVRFCASLPGFPSFFFFPSLLVSFSFLISFFPRAGGGWSLFCYC